MASINYFNEMYDAEHVVSIPFNKEWNNKTEYLDHATKVVVETGKVVKSYCNDTKRKILLVGTPLGTVVIFERYSGGQNGIYVSNWHHRIPFRFRNIVNATSSLSQDTIRNLIGDNYEGSSNVGTTLSFLFKEYDQLRIEEQDDLSNRSVPAIKEI